MLKKMFLLLIFLSTQIYSQSDISNIIKGGELLLSGLSVLKVAKPNGKEDNKLIESVCIKNKLNDKVTFKIVGKSEEGDEIKKELVIQKDGKECLFLLPKGIYTYEIILANKETYKKGEYKFEEDVVITVKDE